MQKNLKKYFSSIFILFFFIVISFYQGEEYLNFYQSYNNQEQTKIIQASEIEDFSLKKIRNLDDTSLYYTPYKSLLDDITEKIDKANSRVYIEVYMLTETRIQDSLIRAKKRGIDVKIVLEKNPYMAYNINDKAYKNMEKNGIEIVWSNSKNYSLNHTKLLIVDEEAIISTGNLTYSTFTYNRDFFVVINDKLLLEKLLSIFNADYAGEDFSIYDDNLVLSPNYSREKLEKMILEAKESIDMYFQYLEDEKLFNIVLSKLKSGIKLNIVLAETALENNKEEIEKLDLAGAQVNLLKKPTIHSKAILVDDNYLFIGSVNFSEYSIDKNREIGIILKDEDVIKKFKEVFVKDIGN
ncbi:MAG: phospholipase D-like domain-containing protein [Candidatus Gracilibacteria bacterium]|nr:phospholipase D-like domain-containing protein [Candidatus Gracilibacteria bacterium]